MPIKIVLFKHELKINAGAYALKCVKFSDTSVGKLYTLQAVRYRSHTEAENNDAGPVPTSLAVFIDEKLQITYERRSSCGIVPARVNE